MTDGVTITLTAEDTEVIIQALCVVNLDDAEVTVESAIATAIAGRLRLAKNLYTRRKYGQQLSAAEEQARQVIIDTPTTGSR